LVSIGRMTALVAFGIAIIVAPMLGQLDQAFQYIQEYTGFVTPGIVAIFILGIFWKKTTPNAALVGGIGTFLFSILFKQFLPNIPFLDRMGYVFLICAALMIIVSKVEGKGANNKKAMDMKEFDFSTSKSFNVGAIAICIILTVLYILLQ